jgi:hypothetical protein
MDTSVDDPAPYILIDSTTGEITVEVEITKPTFFAKIIGYDTMTVRADASSNCFPPGATDSVIPVAWSCRPPVGGTISDSDSCTWKAIPWHVMEDIIGPEPRNEALNPILGETGQLLYHDDRPLPDGEPETAAEYLDNDSATNPNDSLQLYIVMDSIPLAEDLGCETEEEVDPDTGEVTIIATFCDLDGDGRFDVSTSDRSWLILDGDENNGQLDDIVLGKVDLAIDLTTWFPGRSGNIVDVYKDAASYPEGIEGKPSLIPVFDVLCSPTSNPTTDPLCAGMGEPDAGLVQLNTAASATYFHVITFAEFYTTCISYHHDCPGKTWLQSWLDDLADAGVISKQDANIDNVFTMEGYFIDGWAASTMKIGSNAIDLGVYVLSLTE